MSDDTCSLGEFSGNARLFPLPNLVLFPHVMQPLHIFEPRYRQLTADALGDDRLMALALLEPGWEADYDGRPNIYPVACLGKIVADQKLDDGRYHILLRGLARVRLVQELPKVKLYRQARVEALAETPLTDANREHKYRRQLAKRAPAWFPAQAAVVAQFRKLLRSQLPLGALCDIIAFALPLEVSAKQALLAELDVAQRAQCLLQHLTQQPPALSALTKERKFPPEFSIN